jgi:hypothetical protein
MVELFTESFQELLLGIDDNIDIVHDICDDEILKMIKTCSCNEFSKIHNFITTQPSYFNNATTYSIYKIDIFTNIPSHCLDLNKKSKIKLHSNNAYIYFTIISPMSILDYINENYNLNSRYIFIPVRLEPIFGKKGHRSQIIFDIDNYQVYFADPNGRTEKFDNMGCKNSEKSIELIMEYYIEQINVLSKNKFHFVKRKKWNPKSSSLNYNYDNTIIGSGHCVIITLLIANYLSNTQSDISKLFKIFENLNDEHNIHIINSYSSSIYELLKNLE